MLESNSPALPALPFDVALHGSSMLEATLEPVTALIALVIAIIPH